MHRKGDNAGAILQGAVHSFRKLAPGFTLARRTALDLGIDVMFGGDKDDVNQGAPLMVQRLDPG